MPKFAANLTMLYNEHGFLDRFAAAAAAGFRGVEFLFPYAFPADEIAERLAQPPSRARAAQSARGQLGGRRARHRLPPGPRRRIPGRRRQGDRLRQGARRAAAELPRRHRAAGRDPRGGARDVRRQSRVRRAEARGRGHPAPDRADQHVRHPRILPVGNAAGARHHRRDRFGQPVPPVRHLPHAADGRRAREHDQGEPRAHPPPAARRQSGAQRAGHRRDQLRVPVPHHRRSRLRWLDRLRVQAGDDHRRRLVWLAAYR